MQAERQEFFVIPTTVHRKNLKKQQLLSPFLSWSCLWEREGRCREEEGGGRCGVPHKGNHWQKNVSYCAPLSCLSVFVFAGSSMHLCFSTHWSLSFRLVVYLCCHVSSSCSNQQERSRTGPCRSRITNTQSKGIVFGEFLPPSWDERILRNKLA